MLRFICPLSLISNSRIFAISFALEDDPKIPKMPKSEDEQRRQNEDYARNLGLDVIDPIGD